MFFLEGHTSEIVENALAFSPDGKLLASGSGDETVRLWDLPHRTEKAMLLGHKGSVTGVGFLLGGKLLASASWDANLRIWDVESGKKVTLFRTDWGFNCLAIGADGTTVAAPWEDTDETIAVASWDVIKRRRIGIGFHQTAEIGALAFSGDGQWLAIGSSDQRASVWRLANNTLHASLLHRGWIQGLAFSPGSDTLAVAAGRSVTLWQLQEKGPTVIMRTVGFKATVMSVAFTPDGETVLAGSKDGTVRLWNTSDGTRSHTYKWKIGPIRAVAVAPDGLTAAAGGERGDIVVWDLD